MIRTLSLALTLLLGSLAAQAEEITLNEPADLKTPPSTVQEWLELQRSGKSASEHRQPLSGEAMNKIHERYINSFGKEIPEYYELQPIKDE